MSRADSQAMCLLSACEAGLLTMQAKGVSDGTLAALIDDAMRAINSAYKAWPDKDGKSARRAYKWLLEWVKSQDKDDTYPAHMSMIAASQQAIADLYGRVKNPHKKAVLEPLFPALEKVEDWFSGQRVAWDHYDSADRILSDMYKITGFEP